MAAASLQAQLEEYGVLRELEAPRGGARVDIDFARTLQPVVEASARILQRLNAKTLGSLSEDDVDALFAGQTELLIRQLAEQLPEFSRLHPSIADHTLRVTLTCQILLDFERLSPRQRNLLLWSSLLHDIA
jgi:response regulator RpfG family c-di-GMP phosphodiesterase